MPTCGCPDFVPNSKQGTCFTIKYTDMTLLQTYADRVGARQGPRSADVNNFILAVLATNRMTYCHSKQDDCGPAVQPKLGTGAAVLKFGGLATGTAAGLGSAGLAPLAAGTAAAGVIGAATLGLGLIAVPLLAIFAHHSAAVANEQNTICAVSTAWNGFADVVEQKIPSGTLAVQDALTALQTYYSQLRNGLQGITHGTNAGYYFTKALDALQIWNKEVVFPSLNPSAAIAPGGQASTPGASSSTGKTALLAGAVIGAKLLGAF